MQGLASALAVVIAVVAWTAGGALLSPNAMAQAARTFERFQLTWTRESGWGTYCVLEVLGQRGRDGRVRLVCHNTPRNILTTGRVNVSVDAEMVLEAPDAERFADLLVHSDPFGGRADGRDARTGDGAFDTLKVTSGRTVVLVTSSNPSFHGEDPARTQLLEELRCLDMRLRAQAQGAPAPTCGGATD